MQACALRRAGAGAAGRIRDVGRGPDDSGRSRAPRAADRGVPRHQRRAGAARPAGPGRELGRGPVPVRRAGQRQDDDSPSGSRTASASTFGFRARSPKTASSSSCTTPPATRRSEESEEQHHQDGPRRHAVGQDSPADGRRRRRADDGQPGNPPRSADRTSARRRFSSRATAAAC